MINRNGKSITIYFFIILSPRMNADFLGGCDIFFFLLLSISIITCIFGANIRLCIISLSFVFQQTMVKLVTINFLCIVFYMIYSNVIFCMAYVIISFSSVSCNSSLFTSVIFCYELLFILSREISTLSFCVSCFIVMLLLPLILIEQHFFYQKFSLYGG